MRMNLRTDYALRMLMYLSIQDGRSATVNEVAQAYGLSRNHLMKVAQALRDLGMVETLRGRTGGIRLIRPAEDINLGVLVRAIEEDFSLVECMQGSGTGCVLAPACRLKRVLSKALGAYLATLDAYTLADIVENRTELARLLGFEARAA